MSHWNHRVIRKPWPDTDAVFYDLHEVYYTDEGAIEGWTANPVAPHGESPAELREDVRWFLQAFRRPILEVRTVAGREVLIEDKDDKPINEGHYFELMDRASVALDYLYQFVGSHPLMRREPRLRELYEKAESILADLYQEAGRLEFERQP
jgi:hypothetical protein